MEEEVSRALSAQPLNRRCLSSGCHSKITQMGWLITNRSLFLTVLEAGNSKIKVPAWSSEEGPSSCFIACACHCVLTWKGLGSSLEPLL